MRNSEEIKLLANKFPESPAVIANLQLEVLLDIRDALHNRKESEPQNVTGEPKPMQIFQ